MIAKLSGKLIHLVPPQAIIDVAGVGYELEMPIPDCAKLPKLGSMVEVFTHLSIREDAHNLYGFITMDNRNAFRQLIKVSGIGPKIGLAILSTLTRDELNLAIEKEDVNVLSMAPGVGKKMAGRMLLELKGKITNIGEITSLDPIMSKSAILKDVATALVGLGYSERELTKILKDLPADITDIGIGVKEALKLLNKH